MHIKISANYTNFLTVVTGLGFSNKDTLFFFESIPNSRFDIWAFIGSVAVSSGNVAIQPGSFSSDFPDAIQVAELLNIFPQ